MTESAGRNLERRLEEFLDDRLDDEAREAFNRALEGESTIQDEVELQRRIDESLRRNFAPPASTDLPARIRTAGLMHGPASRLVAHRRLALAASLLLCVLGGWMIWTSLAPRASRPNPYDQPFRTIAAVYHDELSTGFSPDWVCETPAQFSAAFEIPFGQPLGLHDRPEAVEVLGLSYSHTLSKNTVYMLARVQARPALLFVDEVKNDWTQPPAAPDGLHLHRRQLGALVLYELSPFDEPRLLGLPYDPGADEEGPG